MNTRAYVQVGLGYEGDGRPELDWAAAEAQARGAALRVIRAYDPDELLDPWVMPPSPSAIEELRSDSEQALDAAVAHVRQQWPALDVRGHAAQGSPAQLLIEDSRDALLTVVGSRQLSTIGAVVLGSISSSVIATADGPVVVVGRQRAEPVDDPEVVVGVDGLADTESALGFAFDYAARRRRPLHAVACWQHDVAEVSPWPTAHRGPEAAEAWLAKTLAGWRHKYPDVTARRTVVHDHPVSGLVTASAGHDLLVVGRHGRRPRAVSRIGSVGQGVLHHARCPVAVVHSEEEEHRE